MGDTSVTFSKLTKTSQKFINSFSNLHNKLEKPKFETEKSFEFNKLKNKLTGILLIVVLAIFIGVIIFTIAKFWGTNVIEGTVIEIVYNYLKSQIYSYSPLGVFYANTIGGLFFVPLPIEAIFVAAIATNKNLILILLVTLAGLAISFSINYFLGRRFSKIFKKMIPIKKFYKFKALINKYGVWAIFLLNLTALGQQYVPFVCGVFKYNKMRFAVFAGAGQLLKFLILAFLGSKVINLVAGLFG